MRRYRHDSDAMLRVYRYDFITCDVLIVTPHVFTGFLIFTRLFEVPAINDKI